MKNILIIGMGRFGRHCARKLNEMGHQVMAIDTREDRIDTVLPYVTDGLIGNSTKKDFMKTIGLVSPKANLLGQAKYFVGMYVGSGIWQSMGWNSIIYIAALSSVDTQLYDAAKIDGANRWQRVVHIEFPVLVPTIMILLIMNMGGILNVGFDKVFLMQNTLNLSASQVISTYVYDVGVKSSQFSFGTAVGLFTNVVNFVFLLTANWVSKKVTGSGLM